MRDDGGYNKVVAAVKVAHRLVKYKEIKRLTQGSNYGYALLLAYGEQRGRRIGLVFYLEGFEALTYLGFGAGVGQAVLICIFSIAVSSGKRRIS